jgi:hypothetical protein
MNRKELISWAFLTLYGETLFAYTVVGVTVSVRVVPSRAEQSELTATAAKEESWRAQTALQPVAVVETVVIDVVSVVVNKVVDGRVVKVVETLVATVSKVELLIEVADFVLVLAVDTRNTVLDLMLRQLQAELMRLVG